MRGRRKAVLDRWPALARALDGLGGRLTADDMRRLDYAVDGEHRSPAEVVRAWRASPQGRSP